MTRVFALCVALYGLLAALAAPHPTLACGQAGLELGVRDLQDAPVAGVVFEIQLAGQAQTVRTGTTGVAAIPIACGVNETPKEARILNAHRADGTALLMDENAKNGGLTIPLIADQTQRVPFRISDTLLFVEPVAEADDSAVFSTVVPTSGGLGSAPNVQPAAAPPIPSGSRPAWVWIVIALVLGAPCLVGLVVWARGMRRGTR